MILVLLIALAAALGWYVGKNPLELNTTVLQGIKWVIVLSSLFWLGGLFNMIAVFLLYQSFFVAARNIAEGKDIWFIDEETFIGDIVTKHLGETAGRTLFFIEVLIAILIILV